jgi:hypothetical protein
MACILFTDNLSGIALCVNSEITEVSEKISVTCTSLYTIFYHPAFVIFLPTLPTLNFLGVAHLA